MDPDGDRSRVETDSLGEVQVPAARYWGAQTQRSLENFDIGRPAFVFRRPMIRALGLLKWAAARANAGLGLLPDDLADAIARAADEVAEGRWDDEFPLVVFQTGSGTQTNMNANEVIANRAIELLGGEMGSKDPVHPNDHVNRSQSSNDVFPTAMYLAALIEIRGRLVPAVTALRNTLAAKAGEFDEVVKIGRTHLQDAAPLRLGQEIGAWVAQLDFALGEIAHSEAGLGEVPIGGTAVGTGLNSHPRFAELVCADLSERTGCDVRPAPDRFATIAAHDAMVAVSGALRTLAVALTKVANDVRWLASGPRAGLAELLIPANEPGSSIMPGKVNPTQSEALTMVCAQVMGNDVTVGIAGSQGHFQLNAYKPVMAHNVLESIALLADASASFDEHCASGIEANLEVIDSNLGRSLMLATALVPHLGYDTTAKIVQRAERDGTGLRDAAMAMGVLDGEQFDQLVVPADMT